MRPVLPSFSNPLLTSLIDPDERGSIWFKLVGAALLYRVKGKRTLFRFSVLLGTALLIVTFSTKANAQEQFTYRVDISTSVVSGTANTMSEAVHAIEAATGSPGARFRLVTIIAGYGTSISYQYLSTTPIRYAFWNTEHLNGLGDDTPNQPGVTFDEAVTNVISKQAQNAIIDPAWNVPIQSILPIGPEVKGTSSGWTYRQPADVVVGSKGSDPRHDEMRGLAASAEITRTLNPDCGCNKSYTKGNPINAAHGAKVAIETDYLAPNSLLAFTRSYNSQFFSSVGGMGNRGSWQHSFERRMMSDNTFYYSTTAFRLDYDNKLFVRSPDATVWGKTAGNPNSFVLTTFNSATTGPKHQLFDTDTNVFEFYDQFGVLLSMRNATDEVNLSYSTSTSGVVYPSGAPSCAASAKSTAPNQLLCVTNRAGRQLNFEYDTDGWLVKMNDPAGGIFLYDYDGNGNLVQVTFPDGFRKQYHYNEPALTNGTNLPNALTGISEEHQTGIFSRLSTYTYNSGGLAISTQHAGGVNAYTMTYDPSSFARSISTPLGATESFQFQKIGFMLLPTSESRTENGVTSTATSTYDSYGNRLTYKDFNGNVTQYTYLGERKLETKRVEASGTPQARTVSTEWHSSFRLPLRIAEPSRLTTNTYDTNGSLLTTKLQATSDATGAAGFGATLIGIPRMTTRTYNTAGHLLTITGPRSDAQDVTTFSYNANGDLATITNALAQATSYSNYDGNGRPGQIVTPDGVTQSLVYNARGKLLSRTVGTQVTSYAYEGAGQLIQVAQPDGSIFYYTYDDADRLIAISDGLGNSITYTLDGMGNQISEKILDGTGQLSRQINRTFDSRNRIQQQTGGAQ